MYSLMHFAFVDEDPHSRRDCGACVADGGKRQRLLALDTDNAACGKLSLDCRQGILTRRKKLKHAFEYWKELGMRFNRAELRIVDARSLWAHGWNICRDEFFSRMPRSGIVREVADVLIRHAKLDRDHEHVVSRQIRLLEGADFTNDASLEKTDDFAAVIKIAGQSVKLPRQNAIGFASLNAAKHVIEDRASRPLGALAFGEGRNNRQMIARGSCAQFRPLRVNREDLPVFILGGFAAVDEMLDHVKSITTDKIFC